MMSRICATVSMPASRLMVGGITARIHILPSSSLGRNSVPRRAPSTPHTTRNAAPIAADHAGVPHRQAEDGHVDARGARARRMVSTSFTARAAGSRTAPA